MSNRGRIVLHESIAEHRRREARRAGGVEPYKRGECVWCGELIRLVDPDDYRRGSRTRHRGDEYETTRRNCVKLYLSSFVYSERELIESRGDPKCVDCGSDGSWHADHEIPLWAGGGHDAVNIVRRCVPCHKAKTKREARERAQRRREAAGIPEPLPANNPGQIALSEAA